MNKRIKTATAGIVISIIILTTLALLKILIPTISTITLMVIAVLPTIYKRWIRINLGIELMVFATVIIGITYGTIAGFIFGAAAMLLSDILNMSIGEYTPLNAIGIGASGIVGGLMGSEHILLTGMTAVAATEIIRQTPALLIGGLREKFFSITATTIHVLLNIWLFTNIAPTIIRIFGT